jgi:hypothetical protein
MPTVTLVSVRRKTPSSTVPFERDPDFVGRQHILMELDSRFSPQESHNRVVLVGLGGVGYVFSYSRLLRFNTYLGNHKLLSSTHIGSELTIPKSGSFGYMQVPLRDLNRDINLSLQH